jgi:hypothetical protein
MGSELTAPSQFDGELDDLRLLARRQMLDFWS